MKRLEAEMSRIEEGEDPEEEEEAEEQQTASAAASPPPPPAAAAVTAAPAEREATPPPSPPPPPLEALPETADAPSAAESKPSEEGEPVSDCVNKSNLCYNPKSQFGAHWTDIREMNEKVCLPRGKEIILYC